MRNAAPAYFAILDSLPIASGGMRGESRTGSRPLLVFLFNVA
jgi:hypothetical protein